MSLGGFSEDYLALYKTAFVQNTLCARQLNYTEVLLQPRFRKCKTCVNILGRFKCSFVMRNDEKSRRDIFPSESYPPTCCCLNDSSLKAQIQNLIALWHYVIKQFIKKTWSSFNSLVHCCMKLLRSPLALASITFCSRSVSSCHTRSASLCSGFVHRSTARYTSTSTLQCTPLLC